MQKRSCEPSSLAAIGRRGTAADTMHAHTHRSERSVSLFTTISENLDSPLHTHPSSTATLRGPRGRKHPAQFLRHRHRPNSNQTASYQTANRWHILFAYHISLRRSQSAPTLPREQRTRHDHGTWPDNGETPATPETDEAARQISWRHYTAQFQRPFRKATA